MCVPVFTDFVEADMGIMQQLLCDATQSKLIRTYLMFKVEQYFMVGGATSTMSSKKNANYQNVIVWFLDFWPTVQRIPT